MNTYLTGNLLGSTSPKDLYDNASNFDEAMNSDSPSFIDRFKKRRQSWSGMQKLVADYLSSLGFEAIHLTYVDGIPLTVNRPTQLIDRAGLTYKVQLPQAFPFSLTGTWATDAPFLSDVSEASLRADLASSTGSGLVGYKAPLATAIARTVGARLHDLSVTIEDFGGVASASFDNSPALQAAIDSGATLIKCMGSVYGFGSTVIPKPGVSVSGSGKYSTAFIPLTTDFIMFDLSFASGAGANLAFSDLNIQCIDKTGIQGFRFVNANRADLVNINFYGCETNFEFDRGGLCKVINCVTAGTATLKSGGIKLWSSVDDQFGFVFSELDYRVEGGPLGVQSPAIYCRRAVGIKITNIMTNNSNYTGTFMVLENDCQGIHINGGLVVGYAIGIVFQKGGGIDKAPINNSIDGVDFDQNLVNAILHSAGANNRISGGQITSSDVGVTSAAIVANSADSKGFVVDGVCIAGYYGVPGVGILLNGTVGTNIRGNVIEGSYQGISSSGNTGLVVAGNDFLRDVTNPLVGDFSGLGNIVRDNQGVNSAANSSTPAVPAASVAYRNNTGYAVRVFVYGGTVSTLQINGVQTGYNAAGVQFILKAGETVAWIGSVAPTWFWVFM